MSADNKQTSPGQLVDGPTLLKILFPPANRPTVRWLADQKKARRVRFVKIGRLCFFNPDDVRADWRERFTVAKDTRGAQ
jgi:hypothetical protein